MIPAPEGLCALLVEDVDGEPVQSTETVVWLDPSASCPAVVLNEDSQPVRADALDGYVGLTWRHRIVAALPGAGWHLAMTDTDRLPVEAWLVRADGHMLAAAVGEMSTMVFDPVDEDVTFVPRGAVR
jgi:hypothetical protein